ncbi:B3 domain-containing transcription factor NGA4-like [Gossypium australe]|uniref:B3 domain-containing transcription factor NGA4-like n=1 Tax=Gossypium australe TaxID=47621 RepID=A0A5B6WMR7_9ROSI|nr:B3 domain-containing transcription factor NGA4-like [Gossypium australe]
MAIVSKQLKKTDIEKRLTIPSKSLKCFPSLAGKHVVKFKARDESGRPWEFQIYTRKGRKYLKPVLTKGWRDFVCSKELTIGDKVEFDKEEKEQGEAVMYRVRVVRAVKIFGYVLDHKSRANKNRVKTEQKQMWHLIEL